MNIRESLMDVKEVMQCLGRSQSYSYRVIKKLNKELESKGYLTENGKVPRRYLYERYGVTA